VALTNKMESMNPHAPSIAAILRIIAPTVSRWKCLTLDSISFHAFKETSPGPFTALETLNMRYNPELQSNELDLFLGSLQLRRLTVVPNGMSRASVLRMPWAQLTHLHLAEPAPAACRAILLQCTNVVSATITTSEWDVATTNPTADTDAPETVLPSLMKLRMQFDEGRDAIGRVAPFFTPLTLPALQILDLKFDLIEWPATEFSAFQMRAPNIAQISVHCAPITAHELITLLRLAPSLWKLALFDCRACINSEFLQAFTYTGDGDRETLAPRLKELHLGGIGVSALDDGAFEAAIRSRCRNDALSIVGITQLQAVSVVDSFPILRRDALATSMADLRDLGLELTM
jgi:hypothetical protein